MRLLHAGLRHGDRRAAREDIRSRRLNRSKKGLDGNICRCGTFVRIMEAAIEREAGGPWLSAAASAPRAGRTRRGAAPQPPQPADANAKSTRGRRSPRCSAPGQAARRSGQGHGPAKYSFDINRPGMIYGRIVRSPHPHARIVSIDLREAQRRRASGRRSSGKNRQRRAQQVMYQGDAVAAVAADTEERPKTPRGW